MFYQGKGNHSVRDLEQMCEEHKENQYLNNIFTDEHLKMLKSLVIGRDASFFTEPENEQYKYIYRILEEFENSRSLKQKQG